MSSFHVSESIVVNASAAHVYQIVADYHVGHAAIVPKKYFKKLEVLEGGVGEGTKLYVQMNVMGVEAEFHLEVTEPEPGRVLAEADHAAGIETKFIVEPVGEERCQVTIASVNKVAPGFRGWIEKMVNPMITRRIYRDELAQLAAYAAETASAVQSM